MVVEKAVSTQPKQNIYFKHIIIFTNDLQVVKGKLFIVIYITTADPDHYFLRLRWVVLLCFLFFHMGCDSEASQPSSLLLEVEEEELCSSQLYLLYGAFALAIFAVVVIVGYSFVAFRSQRDISKKKQS